MEFERTIRYGSKFCLAMLKIRSFSKIEAEDGIDAADRFIEDIDLLLQNHIRMGDNCAKLDRDTILILAPEIEKKQLMQFFERMRSTLPGSDAVALDYPLNAEDMLFVGTRITTKGFNTPEELLSSLKKVVDGFKEGSGPVVIDETDLPREDAR